MLVPAPSADVFEREFLEIRAKILELAAAFDRCDRARAGGAEDPRWRDIREAVAVLQTSNSNRAERVQQVFSLPYEPDWQREFGVVCP
jgi:hypothetical protein